VTDVSVTVQPSQAPSPYGTQIAVPFHIDPATGGVAVVSQDLAIINQHLLSAILTLVGERRMLPSYGTEVDALVFGDMTTALAPLMGNDVKNALGTWVPSIVVSSVAVDPSPTMPNVVVVSISYTVPPGNTPGVATFNLGGSVSQVIAI